MRQNQNLTKEWKSSPEPEPPNIEIFSKFDKVESHNMRETSPRREQALLKVGGFLCLKNTPLTFFTFFCCLLRGERVGEMKPLQPLLTLYEPRWNLFITPEDLFDFFLHETKVFFPRRWVRGSDPLFHLLLLKSSLTKNVNFKGVCGWVCQKLSNISFFSSFLFCTFLY